MSNIELRKAPCRAKDPSTCPYHGAVIRMEKAAETLDLDAYFAARQEVETAETNGWVEDQIKEKDYSISSYQVLDAINDFNLSYQKGYSLSGVNGFALALQGAKDTRKEIPLGNVGTVKFVDAQWGVTDGPTEIWCIFETGNRLFKLEGYYSSWDGDDWYSHIKEVIPTKKITTEVSTDYKEI